MAHHFKVEERPHQNKDGSTSKTKKDYVLIDRTRRGSRVIDVLSSVSNVKGRLMIERKLLIMAHLEKHPNDMAFRRKHGLLS